MTQITRNPVRLSSFPYLLAAVLYIALDNKRDPAAMAQKAHRLINKVSYKHEMLDRTAQAAFGTPVNEYLSDCPNIKVPLIVVISHNEDSILFEPLMEAIDKKDANFGHLRDFINHCLSGDE